MAVFEKNVVEDAVVEKSDVVVAFVIKVEEAIRENGERALSHNPVEVELTLTPL